jgi:hypothetical protein
MTYINDEEELLSHMEAARFLGIKEHHLQNWRIAKCDKLPYIKVGNCNGNGGRVKYKMSDLIAFKEKYLNEENKKDV